MHWVWEKLVLLYMPADLIFRHEQNGIRINIKFHIQNKSGLLFLSTVAIRTSSLGSKWKLGKSWDGCEWLHSSYVVE